MSGKGRTPIARQLQHRASSLNPKQPFILSFYPVQNKTRYSHIKPGIYIFVQDKHSKQVFLWNSKDGHGHPLLANLVNKDFQRDLNDFSWIEAAGEMVFGRELLAQCYFTGFFYDSLGLTEPTSEGEFASYSQRIREKLESSHLPVDRYFYMREWEQLFNSRNRGFFFQNNGLFQNYQLGSIVKFRQELQLTDPNQPYSDNVRNLLSQLLGIMEQFSFEDRQTRTQTAAHNTLLASQGFFSHSAAKSLSLTTALSLSLISEQSGWKKPRQKK